MTTRNMIAALGAVAAFAVAGTLHAEAYTSASYVQGGLIAQWDGIDNAGTGTHDPNATVWKDLVGNLDMTLTAKGRWNMLGNALYVSGMGAQGPRATPAYKTIEIVFKMKRDGGRIMFGSGLQSRLVGVDPASGSPKTIYFNGKGSSGGNDKCFKWSLDTEALCTATATYTGDNVADVYCDGAVRNDGNNANNWGVGDAKVAVGGRLLNESYPWFGEIYAIRLYDTVLTAEEIAANAAIDRARFQPTESSLYVQDGLIAQWDGKDNAGRGTHDAAATVWKDLVGSGDVTIPYWVEVRDNSLVSVGDTVTRTAPTLSSIAGITGDDVTIEVVARRVRWTKTDNYLNLQSVISSPWGDFGYRLQYDNRFFSLLPPNGSNVTQTRLYNIIDSSNLATMRQTMSARITRNSTDAVNDFVISGAKATLNYDNTHTGTLPSVWTFFNNTRTEVEFFAIRVYNRRLTDEELAANAAIDQRRFVDFGEGPLQVKYDGPGASCRREYNCWPIPGARFTCPVPRPVADGAGASGRILLSVPVGAVFLSLAFVVLPRLWKKAGADA